MEVVWGESGSVSLTADRTGRNHRIMLPDLPTDGQRTILTSLIDTNVRIIMCCLINF